MAQLIDIQRIVVDPKKLTARIRVADSGPLFTDEDLEGTTLVYRLLPHIVEHACMGDGGETFRDVMGATEIAHLLEHVTVELLAQTGIAGEIAVGRTYEVAEEERSYDIELACEDDVLVAGALSSAAWIMQWAFSGGGDPIPDVEAIVSGLVSLTESLGQEKSKQTERADSVPPQNYPTDPDMDTGHFRMPSNVAPTVLQQSDVRYDEDGFLHQTDTDEADFEDDSFRGDV
ncbi:MAG: hypothetical protein IJ125_09455 [Atopobiaceae bacterium]|nr:hypothetical protein [Atopobiaceae bacterium]